MLLPVEAHLPPGTGLLQRPEIKNVINLNDWNLEFTFEFEKQEVKSRCVRRGAVFARFVKFLAENLCPLGLISQVASLSTSMQGGTDNLVRFEKLREGSESQAELVGQS